jgi:hypothetical protein
VVSPTQRTLQSVVLSTTPTSPSDIPAGERADHRERLGSALRESLFSDAACEPPLCPGAEQGAGLRRAARRHQHRVSRSCPWLEANCGAAAATAKGGSGGRPGPGSHCETEVGATGEPPLARACPVHRAAKSAAGRGPSTVGLALRSALNALPFVLRRAPLRSKPTDRRKAGCPRSSPTRIVAPRATGREIS